MVCYAGQAVVHQPLSDFWLAAKTDSQRSSFNITYVNDVPSQARNALEFATSIWGSILTSSVPFNLSVTWDTLATNVLASAGPTTIYRNSFSVIFPEPYWYPVALAEAIQGNNLNGNEPDMTIRINSDINWYYGGAQQPGPGQYDFTMVMIHELCHTLGLFSPASAENDTAELGFDGLLLIYEAYLLDRDFSRLTNAGQYPNPSPELYQALTEDSLFFDCPEAEQISGEGLKLHAPGAFRRGSSVAHLDESSYPAGSPHALMTPNIGIQESSYDPGALTLCIMAQMGWDVTPLTSIPLSFEPGTSAEPSWSLYPNPAQRHLRLQGIPSGQALSYAIRDQQGRVHHRGTWQEGQPLAVAQLSAGYYLLELTNSQGERQWLRFLKQ